MQFNLFPRRSATQSASTERPEATDAAASLVVYGTAWCGDCHRSRRFLDRHGIPYQWINVDQDPAAVARVLELNRGKRSVPTIIFPDGSTLTEPSDGELAQKLGIDS